MQIIHSLPFVFYGEVFKAHLADDRQWYLPINEVCGALGLNPDSQRRRIHNDEAINHRLVNIPMETPYQESTRQQAVACLNLRALPYWLGTIDVKRVKAEHRQKVILYKREFAEAAWAVFRSDIIPPEVLAEMDAYATPQEQEYAAIMDQARQLRRKIDLVSGKLDEEIARVGGQLADLAGRLGILETRLAGQSLVNPAQARQLQAMIGLVAEALGEKSRQRSRSQCFAEVHEDFKSTFQVHIYSALPEEQLERAIDFLAGRWARLNPGKPLPELLRGSHQPGLF
jgi:hypothetical protein